MPPRRWWQGRATAIAVAVVLLAVAVVAALQWHERAQALQAAVVLAERRTSRLADEVQQALSLAVVAQAHIEQRLASLGPDAAVPQTLQALVAEQLPLLQALPLPLRLVPLGTDGRALVPPDGAHAEPETLPTGPGWKVAAPRGSGPDRVVPMVRLARSPAAGLAAFRLEFDHAGLLRHLERERVNDSAAGMLRLDDDGATTVLARAPHSDAEVGRRVQGPLAQALARSPKGSFNDLTQLAGTRRIIAYQRLDGDGAGLVLAYSLSTDAVLAGWRARLPWEGVGLLALAATLLAGARRLDRSVRAQVEQQQQLQRSEMHLRVLAANLPDVVARLDMDGRHLFVNAAVQQATGLPPEAFIGRTNAELGMPADKVALWTSALQRVLATGRSERLEFSYPGPSGLRHWESVVAPEPGLAGEPRTVLVISRDVSDRHNALQALADSEERLRLALQAANQGLYDLDLRSGRAVVSPEYARMLGFDPEGFRETNEAWMARMHPDDLPGVQQVFEDYVAGRRSDYRVECRQRRQDGGWKWILSVGRIQERAADGSPIRMLGTHTDLDAIKAAQAAQLAANRRFEKLFQAAPEAMSVSDLDSGEFLQVNDAFCELFDREREAVIGRTAAELGVWTRAEGRSAIVARVRAGEAVKGFEGVARRGGGDTVDVLFSAERIELDGRDCLLLMFRDISQRKRLEAALRASEQRFRLAASYGQVWEWDFNAGGLPPSDEFFVHLGYGSAPITRENQLALFERVMHPDDLRRMQQVLVRHLRRQGPYQLEFRATDAQGRLRWFQTQGQALFGDDGRAHYMAGTTFEITERRQAEEQVRRLAVDLEQRVQERTAQLALSEARYRAIFDTVPLSISEEDWSGVQRVLRGLREQGVTDGPACFASRPDIVHQCLCAVKITRMNRKALALHEMTNLVPAERDLKAFFPGDTDEMQFVGELEAMWAGQRQFSAKRRLPSASGQMLNLMLTMSLPGLDDEDGTALVCLVDITEIDRLNVELDRSVERLKKANRELETFTYSVSHDLKAPLRGIDGYSRLLLADHQHQLDEEGQTFLRHIRQATQHMGVLIDDLLTYSRLERRELAIAVLDVASVVEAVLAGFRADLAAAGVQLQVVVPTGLRAMGDGQGLTMALRNLVDNAFKFSRHASPPCIWVEAMHVDGRVQVTVRDNGVGFDMKFHDRIFSIFQRLHRAEDYPGTGIGLAIVRKAMERMGGQAWAHSQPGQGATFTLQLPEAPTP